MKFLPETQAGVNMISRHERAQVRGHEPGREGNAPARLWLGQVEYTSSVFVPWVGAVTPWAVARWEDLASADFERMAAFEPELVIFGSGERMRFAPPALLRPLAERRIGIECMDTAAACRTYNVLVAERRPVLAALLLGVP
jgi:uncharacterized protein